MIFLDLGQLYFGMSEQKSTGVSSRLKTNQHLNLHCKIKLTTLKLFIFLPVDFYTL